jgi:hypothetical protein
MAKIKKINPEAECQPQEQAGQPEGKPSMKLTDSEAERFGYFAKSWEALKLRRELLSGKRSAIEAKVQILNLTIRNLEISRLELESEKNGIDAEEKIEKAAYESHLKNIRGRLGFEGNFGFNNDTREIVVD